MNCTPVGPAGVLRFEPKAFGDSRGWFHEAWRSSHYSAHGLPKELVQLNVSRSAKGVVRGLHFQEPKPQGKLVMCLEGQVVDYAVDIRPGSATYGQWWSAELTDENHHQLWVPPGFAHGFEVLSDSCLFAYLMSEVYLPEFDRAIRYDDPTIGIQWKTSSPLLSAKDHAAPLLSEIERY